VKPIRGADDDDISRRVARIAKTTKRTRSHR
jgi:predicted transcriptional regulator